MASPMRFNTVLGQKQSRGFDMDDQQAVAVESGLENQVSDVAPDLQQSSNDSNELATSEKMFKQSEVQAIAAKEARKAAEKAEARVRAQLERSQQPATDIAPTLGGMPNVGVEEIQRLIREEAFKMSREHQAHQIEDNWNAAMQAEKIADPEFADLYDAIGIESQPSLIIAMAGMDNKAQVVKDLAKNPSKYANILTLANGGSPRLAQIELNKLSASIKANEKAKNQPHIAGPLSQIKSSNISGDDSKLSTTDFRNQNWLRG